MHRPANRHVVVRRLSTHEFRNVWVHDSINSAAFRRDTRRELRRLCKEEDGIYWVLLDSSDKLLESGTPFADPENENNTYKAESYGIKKVITAAIG